jgi:hypothetical protein
MNQIVFAISGIVEQTFTLSLLLTKTSKIERFWPGTPHLPNSTRHLLNLRRSLLRVLLSLRLATFLARLGRIPCARSLNASS